MTFRNLKTGSTLYIFHKDNSPKLEVGVLTADPEIKQKTQQNPQQAMFPNYIPQQAEQVVNLTVRIGERIVPVQGLTPSAVIQDCGNNIFVSCSRDAINTEVVSHKQTSDLALDEELLAVHRIISNNCKGIMAQLNPEIAERERIEQENKELRDEIKTINGKIDSLIERFSKGLEN